jgi:hypothetical protein
MTTLPVFITGTKDRLNLHPWNPSIRDGVSIGLLFGALPPYQISTDFPSHLHTAIGTVTAFRVDGCLQMARNVSRHLILWNGTSNKSS